MSEPADLALPSETLALLKRVIDGEREARTPAGDTAAHLLARDATSDVDAIARALMLLATHGADLSGLNFAGATALDQAARDEVRAQLVRAGAKSAKQAVSPTPAHRGGKRL